MESFVLGLATLLMISGFILIIVGNIKKENKNSSLFLKPVLGN